jgi:hypothetical protein
MDNEFLLKVASAELARATKEIEKLKEELRKVKGEDRKPSPVRF